MQKICLISFDNWKYDQFIVEKLVEKGYDAYHINLGSYKHATIFKRIKNLFSKIFLGKNLKKNQKQKFIIDTLISNGFHDQILVINPDVIDLKYHKIIKKQTKKYITYLYDSLSRCPVEHLIDENLFDEIYSFDENDCNVNGFTKMNNYIYFEKKKITFNNEFKVSTISSFDKRFRLFNTIGSNLVNKKYSTNFIFVSRNINFKTLKYNFKIILKKSKEKQINPKFKFQSKKIPLKQLFDFYAKTDVILDLVQGTQTGLSFRVFEAIGFQKKIITDNKFIQKYPFYDKNNIYIIGKENTEIPVDFLNSNYVPIPDEIYNQFTLETWVNTIFNLKN